MIAEITTHHFLRWNFIYNTNKDTIMNDLENIPFSFSAVSDNNLISLLLSDNDKFTVTKNRKISMSTVIFIKVVLSPSKKIALFASMKAL